MVRPSAIESRLKGGFGRETDANSRYTAVSMPPKSDGPPKIVPQPYTAELTEATMAVQLPDPGIARLKEEFSSENLTSMQAALRRCEVVHVAEGSALEGFNFRGFIKNLKGMGKVELKGIKLYTLLTRNNAFLYSNLVGEQLHDLLEGFMDLYLGDRAVLLEGDKRRYLFKVPSEQVETLRLIANQNRFITAQSFPFSDLEQFRRRLGQCTTRDPAFDVPAFAASVKVVSNLYDGRNNDQYHHIVAGEMEYPYTLYVSPHAPIREAIDLYSGAVHLALVRD